MPPPAWIYRSTPVGHDACLLVLDRELRRSLHELDVGEGVYERLGPDERDRWIAIAGERPHVVVERFVVALGLEFVEQRSLLGREGWGRVTPAG